jgi:hypothetical protein
VEKTLEFIGAEKGQIFSFVFLGESFLMRVTDVKQIENDKTGKVVIDNIVPSYELEFNVEAPLSLVHGVGHIWKPRIGWHALDLHISACTDSLFCDLIRNLKQSKFNQLVIWGLDCAPSSELRRFLKIASDFSEFSIVLVAAELHLVDPAVLTLIKPEDIISQKTEHVASLEKKKWEVPTDLSLIPISALEAADTYFLLPLRRPELARPFLSILPTLAVPKVLIHGPPQSGKSTLAKWMIAKAVLSDPSLSVFEVRASSLFSKYFGSSEKRINKLFSRAAASAPAVLLIEGIQAICPSRMVEDDGGETGVEDTYNRVVATFLTCLDGLETRDRKVCIIGTSVFGPDKLDPAAVRPGRLEVHISLGNT